MIIVRKEYSWAKNYKAVLFRNPDEQELIKWGSILNPKLSRDMGIDLIANINTPVTSNIHFVKGYIQMKWSLLSRSSYQFIITLAIYWYTFPNTPKRGINTLFFSRHWNAYHKDSPVAISINTPQFHIGFCFDSRCSGCPIDQCKFSKAAPLPNTGGPFTVHINLEEEYIHIYFKIYFVSVLVGTLLILVFKKENLFYILF